MTAFEVMEGKRLGRRYPVTILVVDHDPTVLRLLRFLLVSAGYSVLEAHTDAEAIDKLTHSALPIDLLLVDVVRPATAGTSSARHIRPRRLRRASSICPPCPNTSSRAGLWNAEVVHSGASTLVDAFGSFLPTGPAGRTFRSSEAGGSVGPAAGPRH
jgi:response regulator RpfG family c-di-GMP phosphodiesterase